MATERFAGDLSACIMPDILVQVHALSRWISQTLDLQEPSHERQHVTVGLLSETGVPYILAALSCLQAR